MQAKQSKLLSISGQALCTASPRQAQILATNRSELINQLITFLDNKNGFFAFESALHVFPAGTVDFMQAGYDLERWNSLDLWRNHYKRLSSALIFFAEDIFGCQWTIGDDLIFKFDPETGNLEAVADNLEAWADALLTKYKVETGWPLAHQWQERNGPISPHQRLVPKTLFVFGGSFTIDNLYAIDAVEGMQFRADIAEQIANLPDGTSVQVIVGNKR